MEELLTEVGVDTLHHALWFDWGTGERDFWINLQKAQDKAKCIKKDKLTGEKATINIGGIDFNVRHDGTKSGFGHYGGADFFIQHGGVRILIKKEYSEESPNCIVQIGALPLLQHGNLTNVWNVFTEVSSNAGFRITRERASRVDLKRDTTIIDIEETVRRKNEGYIITRAKKGGDWDKENQLFLNDEEMTTIATYDYNYRKTGLSIGKKLGICRIYDKTLEMREQKDADYCNAYIQRYGEREDDKHTTRIEYQLNRKFLSKYCIKDNRFIGIDTVDDISSNLSTLWHYLTNYFFAVTDKPVDRKNRHQNRASLWEPWHTISNKDIDSFSNLEKRIIIKGLNVDACRKSGLSNILQAMALEGYSRITMSDIHNYIDTNLTVFDANKILRNYHIKFNNRRNFAMEYLKPKKTAPDNGQDTVQDFNTFGHAN
jgi:hypothetical protein